MSGRLISRKTSQEIGKVLSEARINIAAANEAANLAQFSRPNDSNLAPDTEKRLTTNIDDAMTSLKRARELLEPEK